MVFLRMDYLQNKSEIQDKNSTLVEPKITKDENVDIRSERISDTQHVGTESSERNFGEPLQNSQPEQNGNHRVGQNVGSHDAGNGFAGTERSGNGAGESGGDLLTEHNRKMLKRMKDEDIFWAESYPGERYPMEQEEN